MASAIPARTTKRRLQPLYNTTKHGHSCPRPHQSPIPPPLDTIERRRSRTEEKKGLQRVRGNLRRIPDTVERPPAQGPKRKGATESAWKLASNSRHGRAGLQ